MTESHASALNHAVASPKPALKWAPHQNIRSLAFAFLGLVVPSIPFQVHAGTLSLDNGWLGPVNGGSTATKELGALLSPLASPSANTSSADGLEIFQGVTYLMPLGEAKTKLNLTQNIVPKNKIVTGGFPKDSCFYHAFDGIYEGGYNKLYLITDKAEQVLAVQLVAESPRRDMAERFSSPTDWSYYNFITNRRKATTKTWVRHETYFPTAFGGKAVWRKFQSNSSFGQLAGNETVLRIDTVLFDPDLDRYGMKGTDQRFLEVSRIYLPKPFIELMLHCVTQAGTR